MDQLLEIDGSVGGGQVLRTALSLSMITGRAFRISGIRGKRPRPGLMRQHLTAVRAAARIAGASTVGAELNSQTLEFHPRKITAGEYTFAIGTAGSTTLVMQTLIPALLRADGPSTLRVSGGTHNPAAPPFEFIERAWLPLLRKMGGAVEISLLRHGFAPAGGGALEARIWPSVLEPLYLDGRGEHLERRAYALAAATPTSLANRELDAVAARLDVDRSSMEVKQASDGSGPGHVLFIECEHAGLCQVFSSIGNGGARAGRVADEAINHYSQWAASTAAVDHRLADQLLLPMALAGAGRLTSDRLSNHLRSNAEVIQRFLPVAVTLHECAGHVAVSVGSGKG